MDRGTRGRQKYNTQRLQVQRPPSYPPLCKGKKGHRWIGPVLRGCLQQRKGWSERTRHSLPKTLLHYVPSAESFLPSILMPVSYGLWEWKS